MNRAAIERLPQARMIEHAEADDDEVAALWSKAIGSYRDSEVRGLSRDGVFKVLYDAGRQAATAFLTAHGYRAKGALGHRHSVFAASAALATESHADLFTRLDLQRGHHTIVPSAEEVQRARRSAARLRKLAKGGRTAGVRRIRIEGEKQPIEVPTAAIALLADAVEELAKGNAIRIASHEQEISTQKAADLLNVSRPFLIQLLQKGAIPFRMVGTHRRLRLSDVLTYRARSDAEAKKAIRELVDQAQEFRMGYD
jgi:excisionase family DNA binding protein